METNKKLNLKNPPLTYKQLIPRVHVWDNVFKEWVTLGHFDSIDFLNQTVPIVRSNSDEPITVDFEDNRFFAKGKPYNNKFHDKKLVNPYFNDVWNGLKTFELRKNDCDYQVEDYMVLHEFNPENNSYSGRFILTKITYKLQGYTGLQEGYCILGIEVLDKCLYFGNTMTRKKISKAVREQVYQKYDGH